jgi:peptide/nickel transport system ATP-binding protein
MTTTGEKTFPTRHTAAAVNEPLLKVTDLEVEYWTGRGVVRAVDGVSLEIQNNEVFGLAGESGCGKSTIAHAITRVLKPPAYIVGGEVWFQGVNILAMNEDKLRAYRWEHLAIVFQSAMNSLNPVLTIGEQITDVIQMHRQVNKQSARERARELLEVVGIDPDRIDSYPHQLSGGMRQRVVIAIALSLNPQLIIMDEPTTALDVVVQRQIMREIHQLRQQFGFSILFITHDLSLLVEFSDRNHVRRRTGGSRAVARTFHVTTPPVHPAVDELVPDHQRSARRTARHSRLTAGPDYAAARLPFPSPLPGDDSGAVPAG